MENWNRQFTKPEMNMWQMLKSLVYGEMQIQNTQRKHFSPVTLAHLFKHGLKTVCLLGCQEKDTLKYYWWDRNTLSTSRGKLPSTSRNWGTQALSLCLSDQPYFWESTLEAQNQWHRTAVLLVVRAIRNNPDSQWGECICIAIVPECISMCCCYTMENNSATEKYCYKLSLSSFYPNVC